MPEIGLFERPDFTWVDGYIAVDRLSREGALTPTAKGVRHVRVYLSEEAGHVKEVIKQAREGSAQKEEALEHAKESLKHAEESLAHAEEAHHPGKKK